MILVEEDPVVYTDIMGLELKLNKVMELINFREKVDIKFHLNVTVTGPVTAEQRAERVIRFLLKDLF